MNKGIIYIVVAFIVGGFTAYFLMPEKTIIKEVRVKEYIKGKTVVVTKPDGSSVSTTTWNSQSQTNSTTTEKWNERKLTLMGYMGLGKDTKSYGVIVQKTMFGRFGLGVGAEYINTKELRGVLGVTVDL